MATAPAESSKKGLGLNQSHSNSALDYSGDTFESFSEEEESQAPGSWCSTENEESQAPGSWCSTENEESQVPGSWCSTENEESQVPGSWCSTEDEESQAPGSWCSTEDEESQAPGSWCSTEDLEGAAVSEALESSSSLAGQSPAEEESEAVDAAAAIGKWIDAMGKGIDVKNKAAGIGPDKSDITAPAGVPGLSPEELAALRRFCSSRISRMQQQQAGKGRRLQGRIPAGQRDTGDCCAVPAQLMNRILLDNTRQAVKQVTEAEIHEAATCPECQQKEAELARAAFLRHKKTLLEGALIQEKLKEQLYSRDMLTLLGEALSSFPKPSEDPRDLWQRLKGKEMEKQNQA